jgi:hypothetical protein
VNDINPIIVRDCGNTLWPDTWALDLGREVIAYVNGENKADILAAIFNPKNDPLRLLDIVILMMTTNIELLGELERLSEKLKECEQGD